MVKSSPRHRGAGKARLSSAEKFANEDFEDAILRCLGNMVPEPADARLIEMSPTLYAGLKAFLPVAERYAKIARLLPFMIESAEAVEGAIRTTEIVVHYIDTGEQVG